MAEILQKRSKEKFYRGKNIEELKKMDIREFAKLAKARTRRTLLRNYDVIQQFIKKCKERDSKEKPIKTHDRTIVIVPELIGKTIGVYNGKEYLRVIVTHEMLGHRLGEFSLTRKIAKHTSAGIGATKSSKSRSVK